MADCWPTWRCRCVCPLALESRGVPGWQGWRLLRLCPFLLQGRPWIPDKRGNSGSVLASNSCGKCTLCHGSWDSGMLSNYDSVQLNLLCQYLSSISNKLLLLFSQVPWGLSPGAHALVQPCQPSVGPVCPAALLTGLIASRSTRPFSSRNAAVLDTLPPPWAGAQGARGRGQVRGWVSIQAARLLGGGGCVRGFDPCGQMCSATNMHQETQGKACLQGNV